MGKILSLEEKRDIFMEKYNAYFGRIDRGGLKEYLEWVDVSDIDLVVETVKVLGLRYDGRNKPRLGKFMATYRDLKQDNVSIQKPPITNDGSQCKLCGGKGYGYVVKGKQGNHWVFVYSTLSDCTQFYIDGHPCQGSGLSHYAASDRLLGKCESFEQHTERSKCLIDGWRRWFPDKRAANAFRQECEQKQRERELV